MQGTERTCTKCGHRCHCYQPNCDKCHNDVCTSCDCNKPEVKDLPDSFTNRN